MGPRHDWYLNPMTKSSEHNDKHRMPCQGQGNSQCTPPQGPPGAPAQTGASGSSSISLTMSNETTSMSALPTSDTTQNTQATNSQPAPMSTPSASGNYSSPDSSSPSIGPDSTNINGATTQPTVAATALISSNNPGINTTSPSFYTPEQSVFSGSPSARSSLAGDNPIPSNVSSPNKEISRPSKAGAIAGGVVGGFIFVGLLVLAFVIYLKRRRRWRTPPSAEFMRNLPTSRGTSLSFLGQDRPLTPTPYQTVRNDSPDEFDEDRPPPFKEGTYTLGDPLYEKINQSQLQAVAI